MLKDTTGNVDNVREFLKGHPFKLFACGRVRAKQLSGGKGETCIPLHGVKGRKVDAEGVFVEDTLFFEFLSS